MYINKRPARSRAMLKTNELETNKGHIIVVNQIDEIKIYLDCRYLSAYQASWRLFSFIIYHRDHVVQRLLLHFPFEKNVYFNNN